MIPRDIILLERRFVLFVQDDQTQAGHRGEYRAARTDDHRNFVAGDALPMPAPLGIRHVAVQHRHLAEASAKALLGLRRQADLGHEHDRLPAIGDHFLDGADVNLGLAAAGDAVQDNGLLLFRFDRRPNRGQGPLLVVVEQVVRFTLSQGLVVSLLPHAGHLGAQQSFAAQGSNWRRRAGERSINSDCKTGLPTATR